MTEQEHPSPQDLYPTFSDCLISFLIGLGVLFILFLMHPLSELDLSPQVFRLASFAHRLLFVLDSGLVLASAALGLRALIRRPRS